MTFWKKSYGDYSKVKKPAMVTTSYDESNDEQELETIPVINNNNINDCNVVSDLKSNDELDKNLFDEDFDMEVKATQRKPW